MYFLLPFAVVSLILLVIGIIRPTIINQLLSIELTRLKIILIFGALTLVFVFLVILTAPRPAKEDIKGESITSTTEQVNSPTSDLKTEPEVKRSSTGICHSKGTEYYDRTTNYKSFSSMETCLQGGGRLPKK